MVRRYVAVFVGVALTLSMSGTALASTHYKAVATGKLVGRVAPATDNQCAASASTIDLAGKRGLLVQRFAEPWGCAFTTVTEPDPNGGGVIARTKAKATGITKYGQRAATQDECDQLGGVLDIIDGLMNDPNNSKYLTGLSEVFSMVLNVGEAMGCSFTSV